MSSGMLNFVSGENSSLLSKAAYWLHLEP